MSIKNLVYRWGQALVDFIVITLIYIFSYILLGNNVDDLPNKLVFCALIYAGINVIANSITFNYRLYWNQKELLTDTTGSRRFLCVEVEHRIDCSDINLTQIYAQLKSELEAGERYWFTSEEEQEIQQHNEMFYQLHPEEELFRNHFRTPTLDEAYEMLSLSDILETLKQKHGSLMRQVSMVKFGNALVASGVERVHTKLGNRYKLVRVDVGE